MAAGERSLPDDHRWWVLGFTSDAVIVAWQDARLACQCVQAWRTAGRPAGFAVMQAAGEGDYLISWYLSPGAAGLLDAAQVDWRRFLIGRSDAAPANARAALTEIGEFRGDHI